MSSLSAPAASSGASAGPSPDSSAAAPAARFHDPAAPPAAIATVASPQAPPYAPAAAAAAAGYSEGPPPLSAAAAAASPKERHHRDPVSAGREGSSRAPPPAVAPSGPEAPQAASAAPRPSASRKDHGSRVAAPPAAASSTGEPAAAGAAASASGATRDAGRFRRPVVALSRDIMDLYKMMNVKYCEEKRAHMSQYNGGFDDADGHYVPIPGEEILGRYTVQETLGQGSFGVVLRCYDGKRRETVALKVTRRGSAFQQQARLELDIVRHLNENPKLNHLVVKLLKVFTWQDHLVLVFELLSFNLYQLIRCTHFRGVSLDLVRKFGYQMVLALEELGAATPHPIIHCDLKPENVLLRNQNRSGIRLIDFGSACYQNRRLHRYIQSRFYRSPEVILQLEYTTAIDRWSLACVLVELHTGVPLFSGRSEAEQLARFQAVLGPLPERMVAASPRRAAFFTVEKGVTVVKGVEPPRRTSLEEIIGVTTGGPRGARANSAGHDVHSYRVFLDFITRLLAYEPEERMSCADALRHDFLAPLNPAAISAQQQQQQQQQQQPQYQERQQHQQHQQQPHRSSRSSEHAAHATSSAGAVPPPAPAHVSAAPAAAQAPAVPLTTEAAVPTAQPAPPRSSSSSHPQSSATEPVIFTEVPK